MSWMKRKRGFSTFIFAGQIFTFYQSSRGWPGVWCILFSWNHLVVRSFLRCLDVVQIREDYSLVKERGQVNVKGMNMPKSPAIVGALFPALGHSFSSFGPLRSGIDFEGDNIWLVGSEEFVLMSWYSVGHTGSEDTNVPISAPKWHF